MGDDDAVADVDLDNEFFRAGRGDVYSIPRQAYFTGGTTGSANDSAFLEYCLGGYYLRALNPPQWVKSGKTGKRIKILKFHVGG